MTKIVSYNSCHKGKYINMMHVNTLLTIWTSKIECNKSYRISYISLGLVFDLLSFMKSIGLSSFCISLST